MIFEKNREWSYTMQKRWLWLVLLLAGQLQADETAATQYEAVQLTELVARAKPAVPGGKTILNPKAISFEAALLALPSPQKSDYLMSALTLMRVSNPPKVSQRVLLGYGDQQRLPAYIEDAAANRLKSALKTGQTARFYAFHVYNYSKGPALVITAFEAK